MACTRFYTPILFLALFLFITICCSGRPLGYGHFLQVPKEQDLGYYRGVNSQSRHWILDIFSLRSLRLNREDVSIPLQEKPHGERQDLERPSCSHSILRTPCAWVFQRPRPPPRLHLIHSSSKTQVPYGLKLGSGLQLPWFFLIATHYQWLYCFTHQMSHWLGLEWPSTLSPPATSCRL